MTRFLDTVVAAGFVLAACAGGNVDGEGPPGSTLTAVELTPGSAVLESGGVAQFSALGRMSDGGDSTISVSWSATGGTITPQGLFTAGSAAGQFSVTAALVGGSLSASAGVTITSQPVVDVTLLPAATGQHPAAGSYGRNLQAGGTYVDPNTNVTVLKLTSATVPVANSGMYHGYSEGGPNISQPWKGVDGQTYYTAKVAGWLVDIRYATLTTHNWRRVVVCETLFAFSLNPATPRIAYVVTSGRRIDRINTSTMSVENLNGWPWNVIAPGDYAAWLQTQVNDTWLTIMLNSNHTVVSFRPSDGFQRVVTQADAGVSIDEPHMDRELGYVYLSTNNEPYNKIVNLASGQYTTPSDPSGINADDHAAPLRGRIVSMSWTANGVISVTPDGQVSVVATPVTDWSGDWHMAGQWVFNNPGQYFVVDQWKGSGTYPVYKGMIGLVNIANDKRILAAHDAIGTGYDTGGQPHPTLAPDGKLVMWTSNMNNSGRFDTFVARVPVR